MQLGICKSLIQLNQKLDIIVTMPRKIEISHKSIIFAVGFLLLLWFLYFIRDILMQLFIALILTAILNPLVTRLSRYKIPRPFSIIVVYVLIFGIVGYSLAGVLPPLISQTSNFAAGLPTFVQSSGLQSFVNEEVVNELLVQLSSIPSQTARFALGLFSNLLAVLTVLFFTFYLLLAHTKLQEALSELVGQKNAKNAVNFVNNIEKRLGGWALGQLTLMLLIGLFTYIGLALLGFPFAVSIAILAGLLEIVPYLGPIIAAIPPIVIGFGISPFMGVAAIALTFLIQQLENYVFVPKVMGKSVGISPIIVLLALAIGLRLGGIIGMMMSIPLLIIFQESTKSYFAKK